MLGHVIPEFPFCFTHILSRTLGAGDETLVCSVAERQKSQGSQAVSSCPCKHFQPRRYLRLSLPCEKHATHAFCTGKAPACGLVSGCRQLGLQSCPDWWGEIDWKMTEKSGQGRRPLMAPWSCPRYERV